MALTDCSNDGSGNFPFFVNVNDDDDYDNEGDGEVMVVVVTIRIKNGLRLVGRRPGDVASCFASAAKVTFIIILCIWLSDIVG